MKWIVKTGIYADQLERELNALAEQGCDIFSVVPDLEAPGEFIIIARGTSKAKKKK